MSNLLLYSDNLSPTSIIQEWTVAEGRRDQMGREERDVGEMFTIINIMKTKKGDETRKKSPPELYMKTWRRMLT